MMKRGCIISNKIEGFESCQVVNKDNAGYHTLAAAMCMLIVLANVIVRSLAELVSKQFKRKTQGWRSR